MMGEENQKKIFSTNLNLYIEKSGKTQAEIAKSIGVSPQTFNTWCKGIAIPRMGKVQALADYFNIDKADLIDEKNENKPTTIAAYFDGDEYTAEELEEIRQFAEFVKNKRK